MISRILDAFGWRGFPDRLFYQTPNALRFELGGELEAAPMRLLRCFDRARPVIASVFAETCDLFALVTEYSETPHDQSPCSALAGLRRIGFDGTFSAPDCSDQPDEEGLYQRWFAAPLSNDSQQIDALLWAAFSSELGIAPQAPCSAYIADFKRRVVVMPYDDRGMDVVAARADALAPIYEQFGDWLLDYDRPRMAATFGESASPREGI